MHRERGARAGGPWGSRGPGVPRGRRWAPRPPWPPQNGARPASERPARAPVHAHLLARCCGASGGGPSRGRGVAVGAGPSRGRGAGRGPGLNGRRRRRRGATADGESASAADLGCPSSPHRQAAAPRLPRCASLPSPPRARPSPRPPSPPRDSSSRDALSFPGASPSPRAYLSGAHPHPGAPRRVHVPGPGVSREVRARFSWGCETRYTHVSPLRKPVSAGMLL